MEESTQIGAVRWGYDQGWSFTPLSGKRPTLPGWTERPRETVEEALEWARAGNVGLRTGSNSGIVVIDLDPEADLSGLPHGLPPTLTVLTGRPGGRHLYYRCTEPCPNSAGRLGPHIDVRGDGGQVVYPGSVHPDTGRRYEFSGETWDITDLPAWVLDYRAPAPTSTQRAGVRRNARGRVSLKLECQAVEQAPEGQRNDTLNRAAFRCGQFIGAGVLDAGDVADALLRAALHAGLSEGEALPTIQSGTIAGAGNPITLREQPGTPETGTAAGDIVLIPGQHVNDGGELIEQSPGDFGRTVIDRIPETAIYRKSNLAGELVGEAGQRRWLEVSTDRMRVVASDHARMGAWFEIRRGDHAGDRVIVYKPCTKDLAGIVISEVTRSNNVRELRRLVNYPVICGERYDVVQPGWNVGGIYYDPAPELRGVEPETRPELIHEVLEEMIVDFPFKSETDLQNFLGLMLTPIIAPALDGNRPMHLILSPLERTGKTKLAEEVFGGVILGRPTPALQITERDEERDKRILALLLQGETLIHLDNLPPHVESGALSALLTATTYQGRLLGATRMLNLENNLTVVASGNNVRCSGEIAKRTIPIVLQPKSPHPEHRKDFLHSNLRAHVRSVRRKAIAALLGMVVNWKSSGLPFHKRRMGGFEAWSEVVGGILKANGWNLWRANEDDWRRQADPDAVELDQFVVAWSEAYGTGATAVGDLLHLVQNTDLFPAILDRPTERGTKVAFGKFMVRHIDAPVGEWIIRRLSAGTHSIYKLERSRV